MERTMAVADPSRWRIVRLLGEAPRTVTQLAEATGLSVAATCRHVQRLRAAGVVEAERRGKELQCRPAAPDTAVGQWLEGLLSGAGLPPAIPRPARVRVRRAPAPTSPPSSSPKSTPRSAGRADPEPRPPSGGVPPAGKREPARDRPARYRELEDYLL